MNAKRAVLTFIAGTALVVGVLMVAGALSEPVTYHGTHLSPAMPAADFTLHSADGPVAREDLAGKVSPIFFGYTSCPDICPMTLLRLQSALEELGPERDDVQVVFVSVDPERDTPERVSAYARAVDPSFLGVTGSEEEIAHVASQYGIYHAKAEGSDATGYLVDHSATIVVLNEAGRVELLWSPTVTATEMADDLRALLR
jgi:protein SCO1